MIYFTWIFYAHTFFRSPNVPVSLTKTVSLSTKRICCSFHSKTYAVKESHVIGGSIEEYTLNKKCHTDCPSQTFFLKVLSIMFYITKPENPIKLATHSSKTLYYAYMICLSNLNEAFYPCYLLHNICSNRIWQSCTRHAIASLVSCFIT